jgi:hypothetical protein
MIIEIGKVYRGEWLLNIWHYNIIGVTAEGKYVGQPVFCSANYIMVNPTTSLLIFDYTGKCTSSEFKLTEEVDPKKTGFIAVLKPGKDNHVAVSGKRSAKAHIYDSREEASKVGDNIWQLSEVIEIEYKVG